jgi:hypothetical protein
MKKIFTLTCVLAAFGIQAFAQCPANDSTLMGSGTGNDVFYNMTNSTVATVSNVNWHMAFSVQASAFPTNPANGAAIRVNSGGNGTILRKLDNANAANWRTIDTTGLYALPQLLDSDSTWNLSAFTAGYKISSPFDFIWGTYSQASHNLSGNKVFILSNPAGSWHKKVFVKELTYDTAWTVIISNVDNSDSNTIYIKKSSYPNKLFVYYNASTNQLIDREPVKTAWDLLWTKYVTWVTSQQGSGYYPVSGVLRNPAVTVEQNNGKKCNEVWLNNRTSTVNPSISTIGYDWKTFTGTAYAITDTFVYFIKAQDGKTYKMTFVSFAGGPLGKSTFNVYEATTGISEIDAHQFSVYPNPSSGIFSIESELSISGIDVLDVQGKTVFSKKDANLIDISGLAKGIYVIRIHSSAGVLHKQIIKE